MNILSLSVVSLGLRIIYVAPSIISYNDVEIKKWRIPNDEIQSFPSEFVSARLSVYVVHTQHTSSTFYICVNNNAGTVFVDVHLVCFYSHDIYRSATITCNILSMLSGVMLLDLRDLRRWSTRTRLILDSFLSFFKAFKHSNTHFLRSDSTSYTCTNIT